MSFRIFLCLLFVLCPLGASAQDVWQPAVQEIQAKGGLQAVLDEARAQGRSLRLPAGNFTFEDGLKLDGVQLSGEGMQTVLQGTKRNKNAVVLTGSAPQLRDLAIRFPATARSSADESALVLVNEATDFTVEGLFLSGGDSAGVFVRESGPGKVLRNRIEGTLADGIHLTARSHNILVDGNVLRGTGDDGIAVVSYRKNRGLTRNIDIVRNLVVDNVFARGISTVGGAQIRIGENEIHCKAGYAGILVASESAFDTFGAEGVAVIGNHVQGCGGAQTGHGAVMISRDNADHNGIWIESNYIKDSPYAPLVIEGQGNHGIVVKDNGFSGFGQGPLVFRGPQTEVVLSGNTNKPPAWVSAKTGTKRKK